MGSIPPPAPYAEAATARLLHNERLAQLGLDSRIEAEGSDQVGDGPLDRGPIARPAGRQYARWRGTGHEHLPCAAERAGRDEPRVSTGADSDRPGKDGAEDGI